MPKPVLTLLGLGPGDPALLTRAAIEHLTGIEELYLRTKVHPTVADLPSHLRVRSFDDLYETAADFETIYATIAETLLERVRAGAAITYAVPGHPLVAEATTRRLLAAAREQRIETRIIAGLSFLEPVCEALGLDPFEGGLQLVDALELGLPSGSVWQGDDAWIQVQGGDSYTAPSIPYPLLPTRPALLSQLYNRRVASDAKLTLLERYPDRHPVTLVGAAGTETPRVRVVALGELDHQLDLDHLTVAYLPALPAADDPRGIDGVSWVVARLLGPGGCPWDREQTHLSLRPYLLEETHEVLEALDAGDPAALSEELGDLLLQILMHSEMARQAGDFDFGDVTAEIAAKLIRRHPHVFQDLAVDGSAEVLRNWESIKRAEHAAKGSARKGPLDGIPAGLPALAAGQKLGDKAARVGFDWPDVDGVWAKVQEELAELRAAEPTAREEELGDLLFVLTRLATWLGVDAETALRSANAKFRRRFAAVEELAEGRPLDQMTADELDALWNRAKAEAAG
jgi:tetrapyrrole methylase family protein/MazG family protein